VQAARGGPGQPSCCSEPATGVSPVDSRTWKISVSPRILPQKFVRAARAFLHPQLQWGYGSWARGQLGGCPWGRGCHPLLQGGSGQGSGGVKLRFCCWGLAKDSGNVDLDPQTDFPA